MKARNFVLLILLTVLGFVNISAQGFKGIVPLESTCADVKRILQVDDCSYPYSIFTFKDFSVDIHFSKEKSSPEDKWCYRVSPGTVRSLTVSYYKSIPMKEFEYDLKVKEGPFGDIKTIIYENRDKGVSVMTNRGLINTAVFVPTPKQHEKLAYECNSSLHKDHPSGQQ